MRFNRVLIGRWPVARERTQSPRDAAVRVAGHLGEVYVDEDHLDYDCPADDDFVVARARLATMPEVVANERRLQAEFAPKEASESDDLPF